MGQRRAYLACGSGGSRRQAGVLPGGWLISWPGMATSANSARSQPDGQTERRLRAVSRACRLADWFGEHDL